MEKQGRVYWITGLSGSGKTTIGTALYYRLREQTDRLVILDGDILKLVTTGGYTPEERFVRASKYGRLAKYLADQGLWVILCTISMFDKVRDWNRAHIDGYIEVFLDVPMDVLRKRDRKGLYSRFAEGKVTHVAGLEGATEFPKHPDVRLVNDGTLSVQACIDRILQAEPAAKSASLRLAESWDEAYAAVADGWDAPSSFAGAVKAWLAAAGERVASLSGLRILELGCGIGQDSLYFLREGAFVTAVDASHTAVSRLKAAAGADAQAIFACADFLKSPILYQSQYDVIYLRRVWECVPAEKRLALLKQIKQALRQDGFLCVEEASAEMEPLFSEAGFHCCRSQWLPNAARWMLRADAPADA